MKIQTKGLAKSFSEGSHTNHVLDGIDITFDDHCFSAIMGASGSGKTTFMNIISTLMKPTKGHVYYDGQDISTLTEKELTQIRLKRFAFIFQKNNLMSSLTIRNNIILPLKIENKISAIEKLESMAQEFGISEILDQYPYECSGGQCQRAAIVRALMKSPEMIFCDEPTGALDYKNSQSFMHTLQKMNEQGVALIVITHDPMVAAYAKEVYFMKEGKLCEHITKEGTNKEFLKQIQEASFQDLA
ncbi:MAG: ABC transporter ATP-binding protein [Intestinibaculum porci]|uniref:ABC transporter ATP-binding protein n=1 Tax=Intestinibaculum porci TaxID=2487118 RepID=UPI003F031A7D